MSFSVSFFLRLVVFWVLSLDAVESGSGSENDEDADGVSSCLGE